MGTAGLAWYAMIALAGAAGFGALRRAALGTGAAVALCRVVALTVSGYVAWLGGVLGLARWWWAAPVALVGLLVVGRRGYRAVSARALIEPELVGLAAFLVVALVRLPMMPVIGTEKPMDLAILATLMRPGAMPPADPWLAGHSLAYYYWGFVPWVPPGVLAGIRPDALFNLMAATLAAVTAQAGWALARALGARRPAAVASAFLVVLAGTADGWRQLLTGKSVTGLDLWASSRQIVGAITEYPLFTFRLGDLHPHLLALPLALAALLLAADLARAARPVVALAALLYGAAAAANPWIALPLGAAILALAVARADGFVPPSGPGLLVWLRVMLVGLGGWLLLLPFWLAYRAPYRGLGLVLERSAPGQLAAFLGAILLPTALIAWELVGRWGGFEVSRRRALRVAWLVVLVFSSLLAGLGIAVALAIGGVLLVTVMRPGRRPSRPALALALPALGLIALFELVYLRDPYGGEWYRMNTVFKASHLAFALLAIAAPALLGALRRRRPALAIAGAVIVLGAGLPHLVAALASGIGAAVPRDWSGLAWMPAGDRAAVDFLRGLPPGSVLVEALGEAYSQSARMSAASGVPAVLGWEGHERVWRGGAVEATLAARRTLVEQVYRSGDPATVASAVAQLDADLVVVGHEERALYPEEGLAAVSAAGEIAFRAGETTVVRFDD